MYYASSYYSIQVKVLLFIVQHKIECSNFDACGNTFAASQQRINAEFKKNKHIKDTAKIEEV